MDTLQYFLKEKKLVEYGYGRLDDLLHIVKNRDPKKNSKNKRKIILVAPSWGKNGLIETKGEYVVQTLLEQSMVEGKQELLRKYGSKLDELQGAAIVVDTFSGEIKAAVGNINPTDFGFNRVINAIRPIGSLIKPFVYLTALRQHNKYNLSTIIDDTKLLVPISGSEVWEPSNFDKKYHGFVPLHKALWDSYNIASARLGLELGYDTLQFLLVLLR